MWRKGRIGQSKKRREEDEGKKSSKKIAIKLKKRTMGMTEG